MNIQGNYKDNPLNVQMGADCLVADALRRGSLARAFVVVVGTFSNVNGLPKPLTTWPSSIPLPDSVSSNSSPLFIVLVWELF